MRIVLAYPYKGNDPDAEIELPDDEARQLLRSGRARLPEPTSSDPTDEALEALNDGSTDDDPSPYAGTDDDGDDDDEPQA